jgi:Rieske Fe-S protein
MGRCEVCGNEYRKTLEIKYEGRLATFDSFECAIHAMAPTCEHCGCRVIGHGVEVGERIFCCANCAQMVGISEKAVNA